MTILAARCTAMLAAFLVFFPTRMRAFYERGGGARGSLAGAGVLCATRYGLQVAIAVMVT
jgi:hypothetical protein